jgi:hypothetical protein
MRAVKRGTFARVAFGPCRIALYALDAVLRRGRSVKRRAMKHIPRSHPLERHSSLSYRRVLHYGSSRGRGWWERVRLLW